MNDSEMVLKELKEWLNNALKSISDLCEKQEENKFDCIRLFIKYKTLQMVAQKIADLEKEFKDA